MFWGAPFTPRNALALVTGLAAVTLSVCGLSLQGAPRALLLPVAALLGLSTATLLERAWKPRLSLLDSLTIQVCTGAACFTAAAAATGGLGITLTASTVGTLVWLSGCRGRRHPRCLCQPCPQSATVARHSSILSILDKLALRMEGGDMLFAFSVAPATTDEPDGSMSHTVAAAVKVIRESGLPHETTSMYTTVEGEWDEVMPVIKRACEAVAEYSPRVSLVLKADLRPGHTGEISGKLERLEQALDG